MVAAPVEAPLQLPYGLVVTRRDLIVFAAGAAAGGIVTLIASLIALNRRRPTRDDTPDETPDLAPPSEAS